MSRLDRAAYRTHAAPSPTAGGLRAPRLGVKKVNGKWYISHAARFDDKEQWMGPYDTIHRATTAIARKLAEEVMTRHASRCRHYGIND